LAQLASYSRFPMSSGSAAVAIVDMPQITAPRTTIASLESFMSRLVADGATARPPDSSYGAAIFYRIAMTPTMHLAFRQSNVVPTR
jgi:hypothetical protein